MIEVFVNRLPPDWIDKLYTFAYFGTLGAFAAVVGYLVQMAKGEGTTISFWVIGITGIAGFYLGMVFGVLVPETWQNRDAIVLLIGATGMKGFEIASKTTREGLSGWIRRWLGGPPPPPGE